MDEKKKMVAMEPEKFNIVLSYLRNTPAVPVEVLPVIQAMETAVFVDATVKPEGKKEAK